MLTYNGSFMYDAFEFEGHEAIVVKPKKAGDLHRLAIKTEYWGAFPNVEEALLNEGFHLCFIKNDNRWGADEDIDRKARFIEYVNKKYSTVKCVPVGMSCGGLIAIKLAARYPELVECLYLDAPVLNYLSCPMGLGIGSRLNDACEEILSALKLNDFNELLSYREMPIHKIHTLAENRIPIVLVAGDSDKIVPFCENGVFLKELYEKTGIAIDIKVILKEGCDHHPHGLDDPTPIVEFIKTHTEGQQKKMANIWHDISPERIKPDDFICVIEIPKDSKKKYELDKETGYIKLDRILHTSTHYPANYGFIPRTYGDDKDPLDVLLLCSETLEPMTLVQAYPIGVITMLDDGAGDEKIIAIPKGDPTYNGYHDISDLPQHIFDEMCHFFEVYKNLENKETDVDSVRGRDEAVKIVADCIKNYKHKFL